MVKRASGQEVTTFERRMESGQCLRGSRFWPLKMQTRVFSFKPRYRKIDFCGRHRESALEGVRAQLLLQI